MRKILVLLLCVLVFVSSCVTVFADKIRLSFDEWLLFYDLPDTPDNLDTYHGLANGILTETNTPLDIGEDVYDEFKNAGSTAPVADDSSSDSGVDVPSVADLPTLPVSGSASESQSSDSENSEVAVLSLQPVPTSGQSYIKPVLVGEVYAPDADEGTLTAALYALLGKPVVSRTWQVQTNYNNSQVGYITEAQDFDLGWSASFLLLLVVLYCIFKAGGALLSKT